MRDFYEQVEMRFLALHIDCLAEEIRQIPDYISILGMTKEAPNPSNFKFQAQRAAPILMRAIRYLRSASLWLPSIEEPISKAEKTVEEAMAPKQVQQIPGIEFEVHCGWTLLWKCWRFEKTDPVNLLEAVSISLKSLASKDRESQKPNSE